MDDEKPSTKHLVLKPREVVPTDPLTRPGDGGAISVQLIHEQNRIAEEKAQLRKGMGPPPEAALPPELDPVFRPKEISPLDPPAPAGDEEAIVVPDILLQNRIMEEDSGWGHLPDRKRRRSRRNRDFLIGVGSVDLMIAAVMVLNRNEVMFVFGVSAIVLFTAMTGWIMFMVMDDY